jgi:hypothetical protein
MNQSVAQAHPAADAHASPAHDNLTREWCTAAEVASITRTSQKRVRAAVRSGGLRAAVIDARGTIRVHRNWIGAWLEKLADRDAPDMSASGRSADVADFKAVASGECNSERNQ